MIRIINSIDETFNIRECENLYNKNRRYIGDLCNFQDIISNSHFYSFYKNKTLLGCIYITLENNKLFLSGFSIRKNHQNNINAINKILTFYNCPIWSKTKNLTAILLLKKCGFEYQFTLDNIKYFKKER